MTLVSQIINDAFRQSNLLALTASPTAAQEEEALRYLNRIVKSVFGNEVGDPLNTFPIGRNGISRPAGFPWWNNVPDNNWFVPKNTRCMLNLQSAVDLYLHPTPDDGTRFSVVDVSNDLSTNNATVHGNGNNIEGSQTITLNTDGQTGEWFYREDLGNWMKSAPLLDGDVFPFPEEFDDFFITMLALRLNPAYGNTLDPQTQMVLVRSKSQIRSRYTQTIPTKAELALIKQSFMTNDRSRWHGDYSFYNPNSMFDKGWYW